MKLALGIAVVCLLGALVYSVLPEAEVQLSAPEPIAVEAVLATPEAEEPLDEIAELQPLMGEFVAEEEIDSSEMMLSGRVNPISGAQPDVHLVFRADCEADTDCPQYEADADPETGEYSVSLEPGTWRIVARADGYVPAAEEGIVLTAGESLDGVDLTLQPGERITGTVRVEDEPADAVTVVAVAGGWERHGITDEFGHFEIEGLPRGEYTVRAYQASNGGDEIKALTGSSVTLSLGHRVKVRGRVRNTRGFPAEGAVVYSDYDPLATQEHDPYAKSDSDSFGLGMHGCGPSPSCYERGVTDAAGYFEVEMAPGETLTLGARLGSASAVVEGVAGGAALIELNLAEPTQKLQLVDLGGRPLPGQELELEPTAAFFREAARTDDQGGFALPPYDVQRLVIPPGAKLLGDVPSLITVEINEPAPQVKYRRVKTIIID